MKTKGRNRRFNRNTRNDRSHNNASKRHVFISHNFSDIEDNRKAFEIIHNLAAHAGINAAAEAKAAGLSRTYIRNYKKLVTVSAAGIESELHPRIKRSSFYIKYKPLTILHAVTR